ncbi:MAG: ABC transporter ATP-binding protein [Rhizobiaceae bacterium]|nr:ABC transporter ATP-binding protein [Rhizobiaceae bacterium]
MTTGKAIDITDVSKTYRTGSGPVEALRRIDLAVAAGEFVSIVGPSGCGKSTLLNMVAGLKSKSSGTIRIGEEFVNGPFTNVGIVFQRDLLMEWRTVLDNVLLQIEMRNLRKRDYAERAMHLLDRVHLADFAQRYPRELSGGMRQRASICRALIHDAPVMLMDEPFGALDALTRDDIAADLAEICEEAGKTTIFITHSISEAVYLSDRVIVMSGRPGGIMADISINLVRPRRHSLREDPRFGQHVTEIRDLLEADKDSRREVQ